MKHKVDGTERKRQSSNALTERLSYQCASPSKSAHLVFSRSEEGLQMRNPFLNRNGRMCRAKLIWMHLLGCSRQISSSPPLRGARCSHPIDFRRFHNNIHSIDFDSQPFVRSIRYASITTHNFYQNAS